MGSTDGMKVRRARAPLPVQFGRLALARRVRGGQHACTRHGGWRQFLPHRGRQSVFRPDAARGRQLAAVLPALRCGQL
ncbi:hypothetical protein ACTMU2_14870 [Cupriavidus basilensis]